MTGGQVDITAVGLVTVGQVVFGHVHACCSGRQSNHFYIIKHLISGRTERHMYIRLEGRVVSMGG